MSEVWRRDEPESPCVKLCSIHPATGLCVGCARSLEEIAAWGSMSADARRAVLAQLPGREPGPGRRPRAMRRG
jgi:predicted Fe-S protein YdhL (DUF1289 family)